MGLPVAWTGKPRTKKASGDFSVIREIRSVSVFRWLYIGTREPGIEPQLWL